MVVKACGACSKPVALPAGGGSFVCPYCETVLTVRPGKTTATEVALKIGIAALLAGVGLIFLAMIMQML